MTPSRIHLRAFGPVLFALVAACSPAQETILHSFGQASGTDGRQPSSGLVSDSKGNLYGTTLYGGTFAGEATGGTVFEFLSQPGGTWKYQTIFNFGSTATDASSPLAGVILDSQGNLYGTTDSGGDNGFGTVYELSPNGDGTWSEQILYSFGASYSDAEVPRAGLIFDSQGNLYGTTFDGGEYRGGAIFELSPGQNGWTETILHNFNAAATDGYGALSGLIFDRKGNLYGTTNSGGASGAGTVYELSPSNGSWTLTLLHSFSGETDGSNPAAGLVFDSAGNLYGTATTLDQGQSQGGIVFELSPQSNDTWKETILHTFKVLNSSGQASGDGYGPQGSLIFDPSGNLYGTTTCGGTNLLEAGCGAGAIFELSPASGATWQEQILYDFGTSTTDAITPASSLLLDASNAFYGTTTVGGAHGTGTVFSFTSAKPVTALPKFSPAAGNYASAQSVQITDATPGATIYYTKNGAAPTTASTKYSTAIDVAASETIKAIAVAAGYAQSNIATASYTIGPRAAVSPVIKPGGGSFSAPVMVTISDGTPGATIYYTTNGASPTKSSTIYKSSIQLVASQTIKAIAIASGYAASAPASAAFVVKLTTAIAPVIAPASGTYGAAILVRITDTTPGATIYYTTNGATPTIESTKYTAAIKIAKNTTLKAIAGAAKLKLSKVSSAVYSIRSATPILTPKAGTYGRAQVVKITDGTPGATIYYTTNGTAPGTSSKKYVGAISLPENTVIKAVAVAKGFAASAVASGSYIIQTATPVITPGGGSFATAKTVTISDATRGAVIYYTLNGALPTAKSTRYIEAFTASGNETVKAIAIAPDHAESTLASAKFTIP